MSAAPADTHLTISLAIAAAQSDRRICNGTLADLSTSLSGPGPVIVLIVSEL